MTKAKTVHASSVVKLGNLYFWKCSCNASASRGAFTWATAERAWRQHRDKR